MLNKIIFFIGSHPRSGGRKKMFDVPAGGTHLNETGGGVVKL